MFKWFKQRRIDKLLVRRAGVKVTLDHLKTNAENLTPVGISKFFTASVEMAEIDERLRLLGYRWTS